MSRSRLWYFTLWAVLLYVSACGHSYDRQVMVSSKAWPATSAVRVFPNAAPEPFETVALLQSIRHDRESTSSVSSVMNALIDQAKSKGCNALSHVRIDIGANKQFAHGYAVCLRRYDASDTQRKGTSVSSPSVTMHK